MSAPWEVWRTLHINPATGKEFGSWNEKRSQSWRAGSMTRYLRADLTCGECAKQYGKEMWRGVEDCAHKVVCVSCSDMGTKYEDEYYQRDDAPACMAFAPKKMSDE